MPEHRRVLLHFLRLMMPHWKWMASGTCFGLIAISATVGLLALSGWFLSAAAHAGMILVLGQNFNYFFPSIGVRIFAILRTLCRYADRIVSHDATFRLLESLRVWFYKHLEPLAPSRLMEFRSGDILDRIVGDIDALDNLYLRVISPSVVALFLTLAVTIFLRQFDPLIALIALAGLVAAGGVLPALAGTLGAQTGKRLAGHLSRLRTDIVDGFQGLAELLVFDRDPSHLSALGADNLKLLRDQRKMAHIQGACAAAVTLLAGCAVILCLYRGALLVNRGELDGAALAMIALAVLGAFDAVMPLPAAYPFLGRTREAGRRLLDIVDASPAVAFPERSAGILRDHRVAFQHVGFRYRAELPAVLTDVDFSIAPGQRVAILGQTGVGKSTLASLLARFRDPDHGRILVGESDIREMSEEDLRSTVVLVSQQAHLFNTSIRENLLLARPDAAETEIWDALDAVQLSQFVRSMPDGLDTWIGEAGKLVSGGQARRLTVARAVLRDAPIWVLDEPTEGLDGITEKSMLRTLRELTAGRTVILITHRLAELYHMDSILILENGRIIEQGTHETLLAGNTRYASLQSRLK